MRIDSPRTQRRRNARRREPTAAGETVPIRHYVDDGQISNDYDPAPDAYLTVNVTDDDTPTLRVSQRGTLALTE